MKTKAAMLREPGADWEIAELELDEPKANEVLIRWVAAGLCHSDEHLRHGDIVPRFPIVGGHEGAGVIEKCGPGREPREGGRPRRHLLPARLRPLPLVRHRALEHLRLRRDDPRRLPARRHVPLPRQRRRRRRDVHARLVQPVLGDLRDELRVGRQGPAAGDRRARRLRRADRLVLVGLRRRHRARRDRDHLRHRRHRRQRGAGRLARRRGEHHRRRPARQQARSGRGLRRHPQRGQRRGGARARAGAHPRRRRRQGDHHRRHRQRGGRRPTRSTRSARAARRSSPASPTRTRSPSSSRAPS